VTVQDAASFAVPTTITMFCNVFKGGVEDGVLTALAIGTIH
jgi:hypothetical protein